MSVCSGGIYTVSANTVHLESQSTESSSASLHSFERAELPINDISSDYDKYYHDCITVRKIMGDEHVASVYGQSVLKFCESLSSGCFFDTHERYETLCSLQKFLKSPRIKEHETEFLSIWNCFGLRYQDDHKILNSWLKTSKDRYLSDQLFLLLVHIYVASTRKTHSTIGSALLELWSSQQRLTLSWRKMLSNKLTQVFYSHQQKAKYLLPLIIKLFDPISMEAALLKSSQKKVTRSNMRSVLCQYANDLKPERISQCLKIMSPLACWELKYMLMSLKSHGLLLHPPLLTYSGSTVSTCHNFRRNIENDPHYLDGLSGEKISLIGQILRYNFHRENTGESHLNETPANFQETKWRKLLKLLARDLMVRKISSKQLFLILDTIIASRSLTNSKAYPHGDIIRALEFQLDKQEASSSPKKTDSFEVRSIVYTVFVLVNQSEQVFLLCNYETVINVLLIQSDSNIDTSARFQSLETTRPHILALYCYDIRLKGTLVLQRADDYEYRDWACVLIYLLRLLVDEMDKEKIEQAIISLCDFISFQAPLVSLFIETAHRIINGKLQFPQKGIMKSEENHIHDAANCMIQCLITHPRCQLAAEDNHDELAIVASQVLQAYTVCEKIGDCSTSCS